jgi:xylulokinase
MLCASFTGVRAGHTKAHFNRAVLEGVAYSLLDCMNALKEIGIPHEEEAVIIGGGSTSPLWRQIVSDVLNISLKQVKYNDSSFGSALLAGVALGIFDGYEGAIEKSNKVVSITNPIAENTRSYADTFGTYKAIHDALTPIYARVKI